MQKAVGYKCRAVKNKLAAIWFATYSERLEDLSHRYIPGHIQYTFPA